MSLRKHISVFLAAILFLLSCGCDPQEKNTENAPIEAFVYKQAGNPQLMAVSGEILYTLSADENYAAVFSAYGTDGGLTSSIVLSDYNVI
ncbi:MAG TPA: hypothetical protein DDX91_07850 [Ruminococcaceae bacterium]|nr:hypothetical protein [Oscillospiraceae bacterium]